MFCYIVYTEARNKLHRVPQKKAPTPQKEVRRAKIQNFSLEVNFVYGRIKGQILQ